MLDFGATARKQQVNFRHKLPTISIDSRAQRQEHGHLLVKGRQIDNLYPSLRGQNVTLKFFAGHNIKLWGNPPSLDDEVVATDNLYAQLNAAGIETLYDDRPDQAAGVKFNDADLLGLLIRLVVSPRNLRGGVVELRGQADADASTVSLEGAIDAVRARLDGG